MMRIRAAVRGVGVLLALVAAGADARADSVGPRAISDADKDFLARHWRQPIKPQGPAPEAFAPLERSLAPESCGTCHPAQLADWKTTLHSRSMGPGVVGQMVEMKRTDPDGARSCLTCHAPLAEQSWQIEGPRGLAANPSFDAGLERQGLACAVCHVRQHQRFGPPPPEDSAARRTPRASLPHNGATFSTAYLRSEFCSSCHQFQPTDLRLNGKLLENAYAEWKASPAARQGLQCQSCHMPGRRHLWRGIHDPDMVKSGVEVSLATHRPRYRPGEEVRATLTIRSVRVGHYFPTYVTPRVVVRGELLDATDTPVPGSAKEQHIGRDNTAQRFFSGRCFHDGMAPRPLEIFQKSSPSLWSWTRGEVQSAGLGLSAMAAGPLPVKVSPWQGTQLVFATDRPSSMLFGSLDTGFFFAFSDAGTTQGV